MSFKKYDVYLVFNNKEFGIGVLKDNEFVKRYITSYDDIRFEDYTQHKNQDIKMTLFMIQTMQASGVIGCCGIKNPLMNL